MNTNVISEQLLRSGKTQVNMTMHSKRIAIAESVAKKANRSLTLEAKAALATCLENTRQITESVTNSSAIPSKTFFMDMVASVIPNSITTDIVSVQAMDSKAGMISYLRLVYGNNKGQVKEGQMFNSSLYHGRSDEFYSSSRVDNEPIAAGVSLTYIPVIGETATLIGASGTETAFVVDSTDATGKTWKAGTVKVNIETGAISGTVADGDAISYNYDNETAPMKTTVPTVSLELAQLPVYAKSRKLAAFWGFDAAYDLKKQYGTDVESLMATQAAAEITYEIDNEIINDLYRMADPSDEIIWSKTAPIGVTLVDHYDSFWAQLTVGANVMYGRTQKFSPNYILCGINVAAVIEVMRNFSASGSSNAVGPHLIGNLGGKYKVYVSPQMDPDVFVMGYKGGNFLEAGYVYCPYMPVMSTQVLMLADFQGQQGYATSYGKRMVNNKLYIRGRITD